MKDSNKVELLAIKKSYESSPVYASPYFDERTQKFRVGGVEYASKLVQHPKRGDEYLAIDTPVPISDTTSFMLAHGNILDKNNPEQAFILKVAMDSGWVAPNFQSVNTAGTHRYYIKDEQAEAVATAIKSDRIFEAMTLVRNLTATDRSNYAFFKQKRVRDMTEQMIEAFVKELAVGKPDEVIKDLSAKGWKSRAFLEKLVQYGLVTSDGGTYKIGTDVIGVDRDAAVAFLRDRANVEVTRQLREKLSQEEGVAPEAAAETE